MNSYKKLIQASIAALGIAGVSFWLGAPGFAQPTRSCQQSRQALLAQASPPAPNSLPVTQPPATSPSQPATDVDRAFMIKAAESDQIEIQTSQLALQRSKNPNVRQYAQRMIQEHRASSKRLQPIAQQRGVTLPTDISSEDIFLLNQLQQFSGAIFDQAYWTGQIQSHAKTQAEYRRYLCEGKDPELRAFASQVLPIVTDHLRMAQELARK
jgi:putative membrane protein